MDGQHTVTVVSYTTFMSYKPKDTNSSAAVDVNIYASNPKHALPLVGNHENTEVGQFISDYLELDIEAITSELKDKHVKTGATGTQDDADVEEGQGWGEWMGPKDLAGKEFGDSLVTLDEYHGDFKHRKREAEGDCGCGLKH